VLGFQLAFMSLIAYASSRTLSTDYGYSAIKIGFVTLSLGVGEFFFFFCETFNLTDYHLLHFGDSGGIAGSIWGGGWSDYELARLKAANGGNSYPEVSSPDYFAM
jgi:hypothetical protein